MDRAYWDSKAKNYTGEIFSSMHEDKNGIIRKTISEYSSKNHDAADFGCGTGHYVPCLASKFRKVYACDLSPELISRAEKRGIKNAEFEVVDLAKKSPAHKKVKFAVSANVLIIPDVKIRQAIIRNIYRALPRGAVLMVVAPSLESVIYTNARLFEWNIKDGMSVKKAIEEGLKGEHRTKGSVGDGLINIDGVTHKHYIKEELQVFLEKTGFKTRKISKIEYGWDTEFEDPPRWMKAPYPWDWMALAVKTV